MLLILYINKYVKRLCYDYGMQAGPSPGITPSTPPQYFNDVMNKVNSSMNM